jgi:hypothetical protein
MVNKLLQAVGFCSLLALLVGFASGRAEPAGKVRQPAKTIGEISIAHHFSVVVQAGSIQGGTYPSLVGTLPANSGLALSQITLTSAQACCGAGDLPVVLRVDGVEVWRCRLSIGGVQQQPATATIVPPIIVHPSASLEVGVDYSTPSFANLTITGWTLDAADFGP